MNADTAYTELKKLIRGGFNEVNERLGKVESRLDTIETDVNQLKEDVSDLKSVYNLPSTPGNQNKRR